MLQLPLSFLALLFSAQTWSSTPVCVKDIAELQKNKSSMPALLQNLPVFLVVDGVGTAALNIRDAEGKIKIEKHVRIPSLWGKADYDVKDSYVVRLCIDGPKASIQLENNQTYEASIVSDTELKIVSGVKSATLAKTSQVQFAQIKEKVDAAATADGVSPGTGAK